MALSKHPVTFIKSAYAEMKLVQWPSRRQTLRLTGYVIGVSLIVGLYLSGLDYIFTEMLRNFVS